MGSANATSDISSRSHRLVLNRGHMATQASHHHDAHDAPSGQSGRTTERGAAVLAAGVLAGVLAAITSGGSAVVVDEPTPDELPRGEVAAAAIRYVDEAPVVPTAEHATPAGGLGATTGAGDADVSDVSEVSDATGPQEASPAVGLVIENDTGNTPDPSDLRSDAQPTIGDPTLAIRHETSPPGGIQVVADPGGGLPPIKVTLP